MSLLLYNCFLFLYRTGIRLVSLWNPKAKSWRKGRRDWLKEMREWEELIREKRARMGGGRSEENSRSAYEENSQLANKDDFKKREAGAPLIWMHCASLGEFEQGRPVLEKLKAQHPGCCVLLTFFSPSGYEVRKHYAGADRVCYLPMDSAANAKCFLDIVKPDLILWIKYEYWYYYITEINKRKIPLLLISGIFRNDQPFFKWYGSLHRQMLQCFTHLFVQDGSSLSLLKNIYAAENIMVSGDTRFDRVIEIAESWKPVPLIEGFCGSDPVIVAGSTWPEDEEELDHYANAHPEIRFIIAPHEISEEHVKDIEKLFKHSVRYSQLLSVIGSSRHGGIRSAGGSVEIESSAQVAANDDQQTMPNVLIIDNIGMLARLYKYATITYVGGGFGDDGVHNVPEAAVYGKPVIFGPEYDKYREAIELVEIGGAFSINNALELEKILDKLVQQQAFCVQAGAAAEAYIHAKKGATDNVLRYITMKKLLEK